MSKINKILYHKAKGGDLRQWRVWTEGPDIVTEHGQVGGKLQQSRKTAVGKNLGKANETSPEEQAKLEAASLWQYKLDRKYSETPEEAMEPLALPMLAHKYEDKKKNVRYPAFLQPKLDGVRCLAQRASDGKIELTSRAGKPYNMPHIEDQLAAWLPPDMMLDGELYYHGWSCQTITSYVKKWKRDSEKLIYNIYDVPVFDGDDSLRSKDRMVRLYNDTNETPNVKRVDGLVVDSFDDMMERHDEFVSRGYEGAILRLPEGQYLWGYRSSELLKIKVFEDAEFVVVNADEGRGKFAGKVVWECRNDLNEETFTCVIKGTDEARSEFFKNKKLFINKRLTVRHFGRTDDKLPRFPVGIVFRDEKDLS